MLQTDWEDHVRQWSNPPVDDVGYFPSSEMLTWNSDYLIEIYRQMRQTRFSLSGWRNHKNGWVHTLGLDTISGKDVVDFGSGIGLETLWFAANENNVAAVDISADNLKLVGRMASLANVADRVRTLLTDATATTPLDNDCADVFHCNGVMHHSRTPERILAEAHRLTRPGGHAQFLLYTDRCWRAYIGGEPPLFVDHHPQFEQWVRTMDQVGNYADWYSASKLAALAEPWFELVTFDYITDNDRYAVARLEPKK